MVESRRARIPRGVLMKILSFLDAAQLFKGRALQLNTKVYEEIFLVREVAIRHLGLIEDYILEQRYIEEILGRPFQPLQASKNYDQRENVYEYMKTFARKHDHKIFMFGYQSIGGSSAALVEGESDLDDLRTVNVEQQNKPGTMFNLQNVRRLFIDCDGSFNSGPMDDDQRRCIVSGIFFNELDAEVNSVDELNTLFKDVRTQSEKAGYSVLRGMKEKGVAVPTEYLDRDGEDAKMEDTTAQVDDS